MNREHDIAALLARVRQLERRQRWMAWTWIALIPLIGLGMRGISRGDAEAGPADKLAARSIQLVDDQDRVRAELGIDEEGSAGLFLRDVEGRTRSALVHDDGQTALYLLDADGQVRVGAAQFAHGGGGFALHGAGGKGSAVLYFKDDKGSLTFYDAEGAVLSRLPAAAMSQGETK